MIGINSFNSNYEGFYRVAKVLTLIQDPVDGIATLDLSPYKFKAVGIQPTIAATLKAYLTFDDNKTVDVKIVSVTGGLVNPIGYIFPGKIKSIGIAGATDTFPDSVNATVYLLN